MEDDCNVFKMKTNFQKVSNKRKNSKQAPIIIIKLSRGE